MACRLVGTKPLSEPMLEYIVNVILRNKFNEILIKIRTFPFKKMHLKMSSAKWQTFCLILNVLMAVFDPISARPSDLTHGSIS